MLTQELKLKEVADDNNISVELSLIIPKDRIILAEVHSDGLWYTHPDSDIVDEITFDMVDTFYQPYNYRKITSIPKLAALTILGYLSEYKAMITTESATVKSLTGVESFYMHLLNNGFVLCDELETGAINQHGLTALMLVTDSCDNYAYVRDFYAYLNRNNLWLRNDTSITEVCINIKPRVTDWLAVGSQVYDLLRGEGTVVEHAVVNNFTCVIVEFSNTLPDLAAAIPGYQQLLSRTKQTHGLYTLTGVVITHNGDKLENTLVPLAVKDRILDLKDQYKQR